MIKRVRLQDRRNHEITGMVFRGHPYTIGIGRFEDGRPAEVFIDAKKQSTDASDDARDGALLLSLALQHGVPLETIGRSVTRSSEGVPAGIVGAVVDILLAEAKEPMK